MPCLFLPILSLFVKKTMTNKVPWPLFVRFVRKTYSITSFLVEEKRTNHILALIPILKFSGSTSGCQYRFYLESKYTIYTNCSDVVHHKKQRNIYQQKSKEFKKKILNFLFVVLEYEDCLGLKNLSCVPFQNTNLK